MIVTLCGSARFEPWFHAWNEALGLAGHAAFGLCSYPSMHGGNKDWYTEEQKTTLDEVHFEKIRRSDAILVLNVFAYMGVSTMRELAFSQAAGVQTFFLESWGKGNGVGPDHFKAYQEAARRFGCYGLGSPVDTVLNHERKDPWGGHMLMGPGGPRRDAIIRLLKEREKAALGYDPEVEHVDAWNRK